MTLIEVYGFPNFINPTRDGGGCSAYQPPRETYLLCGGQAQAATGSSGPASGEQFGDARYIFFSVSLPGCCLGYVHKADSELLCNVCMAVLDNRTTILPITASLMCTGADHYFRPSKPHSGKLCNVSFRLRSNSP